MRSLSILSILPFTLLPAIALAQPAEQSSKPAARADLNWPARDYSRFGDYNELSRAIATTNYRAVLRHPTVAENLKTLAGPYYEWVTAFSEHVFPVGYYPGYWLILRGDSVRTDRKDRAQREEIMIMVDWDTGYSIAALKNARETLVFAVLDPTAISPFAELPPPMAYFIREQQADEILFKSPNERPAEPNIHVFNFQRLNRGRNAEYLNAAPIPADHDPAAR